MANERRDPTLRPPSPNLPAQPSTAPARNGLRQSLTPQPSQKPGLNPSKKGIVRGRGGNLAIAGALASAINHLESATKIRESLALAYWRRVVGDQAAAASEATQVRDGILFVRTKSSVWSHELNLYKSRILMNLNRMLGGKIIQDIVFQAQGVTPPVTLEEETLPSEEELKTVVLTADEKMELRGLLNDLIHIEDDHIRAVIATRLTLEAKLRHWKLERGWRVCPRCVALHKTEFRICPICRLCS